MSWVIAFAGFATLIILHELGHFAAAKAVGMRVERFSLFFGRTPLRFRRGETEYGIGWIPLGGFVKITGMNPQEEIPAEAQSRAYYRQPVWKRLVVIAAGPAVNIVLAFVILMGLYWFSIGDPREAKPTNRIEQITPKSPASEVLQEGDRIVAVDGRRGKPDALRKQIATHRCAPGATLDGCRAAEPVRIELERGGSRRTIEAFPVYNAQSKRPLLGFAFDINRPPVGPVVSLASTESWC